MNKIAKEEILLLLKREYGLTADKIDDIGGGRSDLYIVTASLSKMVLKIYQANIQKEQILKEVEVCTFLLEHSFQTSRFVRTIDGKYVVELQDRFCALQYYVNGHIYRNHEVPDWMLTESAHILGRLHTLLRDYCVEKGRFKECWLSDQDYEQAIADHISILKCAETDRTRYSLAIVKDMLFKIDLLSNKSARFNIDMNRLTYSPSHGDYCLQQMVVNGQNDITLIDMTSVDRLPIIWEIVRSYSFIGKECKYGKISIECLSKYIDCYEMASPLKLSQYDKQKMFEFYAAQLLLSPGGYLEYFSLKDEKKRTDFLQFGFWRTRLMQYMLNNTEK